MSDFHRGDIILADLPFSDSSGAKRRPAIVVQCNRNNQRLDDVIVALITSQTQHAVTEPTQVLVDITTTEGQGSGLLHTSAIKCEHLITLHCRLIWRVIGRLPSTLMQQVDDCLRISLDLS
ncbi:MAG: type II toxin-antitoxin system PemK/MazF family toxin [Pirellulales bacterium]